MGNTINTPQKEKQDDDLKALEECPPLDLANSRTPEDNPLHLYVQYRTPLPIQTFSSIKTETHSKKQLLPPITPLSQIAPQQPTQFNPPLPKTNPKQTCRQSQPLSLLSPNIPNNSSKHRHSTPINLFKQHKVSTEQFLQIKQQPIENYYSLKQKIGEGTFGQVFRAICLRNQQQKAIKILKTKYMKQQHTSSFLSEMTLLSKIHHPSIISLYEVFLSHGNYYVVMEYCKGGSIVDIISKIRRKSEAIVVNIMQQLLSALSYLHANNIVHRDIKLENIVFLDNVSEGQNEFIPIKIIDFGSAVQTKYKIVQNYPIAGTLPYLAPEVLKGLLSERSDIWSSGVLMIILLTGVSPFKGKNEAQTKFNLTSVDLQFSQGYLKDLSNDAKDLLRGMLQRSVHKRISAHKASTHPWFHQPSEAHKQISPISIEMLQKYQRSNNLVSAMECFLAARTISQQERQKLAQIFNRIDHDGNGVITVNELAQVYSKYLGGHSEKQARDIANTIDANQSGCIDFNEFIVAMEGRQKLFVRQALDEAFDYFDRGKKGYLDLRQILKGSDKDEVEYYLNELDTDRDRKVSREEFVEYLTRSRQ